jgi:hypothetical protein
MSVTNTKGEQIVFFAESSGDKIELLINPETITLLWRKVYNRVRTKARLVTFFWGEEPVKFVYSGQTGNIYPTASQINAGLSSQQSAISDNAALLQTEIAKLQAEIIRGGPYTYGNVTTNQTIILQKSRQINNYSASLFTNKTISSYKLQTQLSNTEIISLTDKFQLLKKLESMYRTHQNPADKLVRVWYRDYIFDGYFESFSYTDDAKTPWNWIYNIDFTILEWQENPITTILSGGEIIFPASGHVLIPKSIVAKSNLDEVVP